MTYCHSSMEKRLRLQDRARCQAIPCEPWKRQGSIRSPGEQWAGQPVWPGGGGRAVFLRRRQDGEERARHQGAGRWCLVQSALADIKGGSARLRVSPPTALALFAVESPQGRLQLPGQWTQEIVSLWRSSKTYHRLGPSTNSHRHQPWSRRSVRPSRRGSPKPMPLWS